MVRITQTGHLERKEAAINGCLILFLPELSVLLWRVTNRRSVSPFLLALRGVLGKDFSEPKYACGYG